MVRGLHAPGWSCLVGRGGGSFTGAGRAAVRVAANGSFVSKATGGGDTGVGRVGGLKVTACCEDGGVATVTGHVTGLEARQSRAWT